MDQNAAFDAAFIILSSANFPLNRKFAFAHKASLGYISLIYSQEGETSQHCNEKLLASLLSVLVLQLALC